jgi:sugar lactone lactonase YvrE
MVGGAVVTIGTGESVMKEFDCRLLHRPATEALRFLPEGPYPLEGGGFSWVAIQHGAESTTGSLNVFDWTSGTNRSFDLDGRPGFAFPTDRQGEFVVGLERRVVLFDTATGGERPLSETVDAGVEGTIINDGVVFGGGLIFGCKDLAGCDPKAGLYLWRSPDRRLIRLRGDQICSNGKVILDRGGSLTLLDIDSLTRTVVAYSLDVEGASLGAPEVVIDLRHEEAVPDGMVATPDGRSVLVALYDPGDPAFGRVGQFGLRDGRLEAVWRVPGSPQVTCPQLIRHGGRVMLVVTTAVEHMSAERRARHPDAGCLFVGDTPFDDVPETPMFRVPE